MKWLLLAFVFCSCTTIGAWNQSAYDQTDFGPAKTMKVCVWRDDGLSTVDVDNLFEPTINDMSRLYKLNVTLDQRGTAPRQSWLVDNILEDSKKLPRQGCDRSYYVARHWAGDYVWATAFEVALFSPPPEYLGDTDDATLTYATSFDSADSLNYLAYGGAQGVTEHEFYHLLGCPHSIEMSDCYAWVAYTKATLPE